MLPQLNIFGVSISTYYLMMFLGFVLMLVLMLVRRKRYDMGVPKAILFTVLVMFSGVLGCKILYILENLKDTFENGFSFGGFSFFGAVFLVPLLMMAFGKLLKIPIKTSLSASAICVCAMIGTIRFGCFLNGCCGGWTAKMGDTTFTWPTQIIEAVLDFILLVWLIRQDDKGKPNLYLKFMLHYSEYRFILEFFRDTPKDWLFLSHGQWFALIAITISLILLYIDYKKNNTDNKEISKRRKIK